jgi:hypothetical protein
VVAAEARDCFINERMCLYLHGQHMPNRKATIVEKLWLWLDGMSLERKNVIRKFYSGVIFCEAGVSHTFRDNQESSWPSSSRFVRCYVVDLRYFAHSPFEIGFANNRCSVRVMTLLQVMTQ